MNTESNRGRAIASVLCLVLAALLTAPAAIAYWGQRTLNDADRYIQTVGPLVHQPQVQEVIATRVTAAISDQVDVEAMLKEAFANFKDQAPRLELLAAPMAGAIDSAIDRQVREFIASDAFADLWMRINVRAQQAFQRIMEGRSGGAVSLQGDEVVLDVTEVVDQVKARLVDRGMTFVENVPIPQADRQIVLMEAPRVQQLRTIYAFSNPVARWLLPLVGALYLGTVLLARRKARATVAVGAVIAVNAILLGFAVTIGQQLFANGLSGTTFGPASTVFYQTLVTYLEQGRQVVLLLGLTLIAGGWFAGTNRTGSAVRSSVVEGLDQAGSAVGEKLDFGWPWVSENVRWLRCVAVGIAVVVLAWGNEMSPERWWWSLALALVLLAILQLLVGAGRSTQAPTQSDSDSSAPVAAAS